MFGCAITLVGDHLLQVHMNLVLIIQHHVSGQILFMELLELVQLLVEGIGLSEVGVPFVQVLFDGVKVMVVAASTVRIDEAFFDQLNDNELGLSHLMRLNLRK